jgi:glycosyltransferase involved in cell wall biosynthesis
LLERYVEWGLPRRLLEFSDNGFELERFSGFRRSARQGPMVRFGFVGTFIPTKGVHVLLEAFSHVSSPNARLLVFGRPPSEDPGAGQYVERLHRLARDPRVALCGEFEPGQVAQAFARFDVLVIPSVWWENSPLTIHEAALTRTPVLASDIGGMAEYVQEGRNGLLFRCGDAVHLAQRMDELCAFPERLDTLTDVPFAVKSVAEHAGELLDRWGQA